MMPPIGDKQARETRSRHLASRLPLPIGPASRSLLLLEDP